MQQTQEYLYPVGGNVLLLGTFYYCMCLKVLAPVYKISLVQLGQLLFFHSIPPSSEVGDKKLKVSKERKGKENSTADQSFKAKLRLDNNAAGEFKVTKLQNMARLKCGLSMCGTIFECSSTPSSCV